MTLVTPQQDGRPIEMALRPLIVNKNCIGEIRFVFHRSLIATYSRGEALFLFFVGDRTPRYAHHSGRPGSGTSVGKLITVRMDPSSHGIHRRTILFESQATCVSLARSTEVASYTMYASRVAAFSRSKIAPRLNYGHDATMFEPAGFHDAIPEALVKWAPLATLERVLYFPHSYVPVVRLYSRAGGTPRLSLGWCDLPDNRGIFPVLTG
ncbi:hypothetical protein EDB84DRAFT_789478 [Lactarius hengduanensis]|nr:hypothetical protein EDB84DRAFT_789478 [Lactarius hengduanensis]